MKALIVDDERLARKELMKLLEEHPSIEIIGEAMNAEEAINMVNELNPDLLFLDIQMPGKTGFQLLEELDAVAAEQSDAVALRDAARGHQGGGAAGAIVELRVGHIAAGFLERDLRRRQLGALGEEIGDIADHLLRRPSLTKSMARSATASGDMSFFQMP